jgi:hypothetical protein
MYQDWNLHGYYARYGNVTLDPEKEREYLLIEHDSPVDEFILNKYQEIEVETVEYRLFKRKLEP